MCVCLTGGCAGDVGLAPLLPGDAGEGAGLVFGRVVLGMQHALCRRRDGDRQTDGPVRRSLVSRHTPPYKRDE